MHQKKECPDHMTRAYFHYLDHRPFLYECNLKVRALEDTRPSSGRSSSPVIPCESTSHEEEEDEFSAEPRPTWIDKQAWILAASDTPDGSSSRSCANTEDLGSSTDRHSRQTFSTFPISITSWSSIVDRRSLWERQETLRSKREHGTLCVTHFPSHPG